LGWLRVWAGFCRRMGAGRPHRGPAGGGGVPPLHWTAGTFPRGVSVFSWSSSSPEPTFLPTVLRLSVYGSLGVRVCVRGLMGVGQSDPPDMGPVRGGSAPPSGSLPLSTKGCVLSWPQCARHSDQGQRSSRDRIPPDRDYGGWLGWLCVWVGVCGRLAGGPCCVLSWP
jgi:hypothetical protein